MDVDLSQLDVNQCDPLSPAGEDVPSPGINDTLYDEANVTAGYKEYGIPGLGSKSYIDYFLGTNKCHNTTKVSQMVK